MSKQKIPQTPDGRLLNYDAQGRPLAFGAKPSIRYTVDAEPWKMCGYSKKWLPLSEFDKSSRPNSKDGYMSICRECMKKIYDSKSQVKAEDLHDFQRSLSLAIRNYMRVHHVRLNRLTTKAGLSTNALNNAIIRDNITVVTLIKIARAINLKIILKEEENESSES